MKHGKMKPPRFKSESEEQAFWKTHDSTHYVDWSQAKSITLPKLKLSTRSISIRLPIPLIESVKVLANRRDVPYQSLLKLLLEESVVKEASKPY